MLKHFCDFCKNEIGDSLSVNVSTHSSDIRQMYRSFEACTKCFGQVGKKLSMIQKESLALRSDKK